MDPVVAMAAVSIWVRKFERDWGRLEGKVAVKSVVKMEAATLLVEWLCKEARLQAAEGAAVT